MNQEHIIPQSLHGVDSSCDDPPNNF